MSAVFHLSTAPARALALAAGPGERTIAFGGGAPTDLARFLAEVAGVA